MTRYQRSAVKGSRPEGLGNPRATRHTALSYEAKYKGDMTLNRLLRLRRLEKRRE
jgi:hypothetical protein